MAAHNDWVSRTVTPTCVYFAYWQDLTPSMIADHLGIAEGTVKRYLARARSRLREVPDE